MDEITLSMIVCPGCGWIGYVEDLADIKSSMGNCPNCDYENNLPPYRLLTLGEMLKDEEGEYDNVRMDLFLAGLFRVLAAP